MVKFTILDCMKWTELNNWHIFILIVQYVYCNMIHIKNAEFMSNTCLGSSRLLFTPVDVFEAVITSLTVSSLPKTSCFGEAFCTDMVQTNIYKFALQTSVFCSNKVNYNLLQGSFMMLIIIFIRSHFYEIISDELEYYFNILINEIKKT